MLLVRKLRRRNYNAIALETVRARHIFLVHGARDAVLFQAMSKGQSANATADDNDMNSFRRCHVSAVEC